jgi:hypothetical protein
MKSAQFDHTIRASGAILDTTEILVIGSQAIHGCGLDALPEVAERSVEVDIAVFDDPDDTKADLLDGSIGEASMFHDTFGYYAQGVSQSTAVLPAGWRDRLVRYETPATNGIVAWCLEVHDLWISKAIANRAKDIDFCAALVSLGIVERQVLAERLVAVPDLDPRVRTMVTDRMR